MDTQNTTGKSIERLSRENWSGKTVSELLDAAGKPYQEHLFVDHKPGSLTAVGFRYEGEGWLYVYVTDYQHMKRFDSNRNWDVEAFKREKIDRLEFEAETP
jgi:hypothetical protein